jgi:hypothetical protein
MSGDQAEAVAIAPRKDEKGRFLTGNIGGGRPRGSRNKLGEEFIKALADDFDQNGQTAIARVREERPQDYLKVIASLLPKEIKLTDERELSDEELDRRIRDLASILGDFISGQGGTLTISSGSQETAAH